MMEIPSELLHIFTGGGAAAVTLAVQQWRLNRLEKQVDKQSEEIAKHESQTGHQVLSERVSNNATRLDSLIASHEAYAAEGRAAIKDLTERSIRIETILERIERNGNGNGKH